MAGMITLRLHVICTDRGQHYRDRLGDLNWYDRGAEGEPFLGGSEIVSHGGGIHNVGPDATGVVIDYERHRVTITCPRCPRHVEWREATAHKVIEAMCAGSPIEEAGGVRWRRAWLDISHLP